MYAQAWALAQDPRFSYWFELEEIELLEQHNQHFRDESNEEQLLPILFDVPAEGKGEFMTTAEISDRLVSHGGIKKPMSTRQLGVIMGKMGFQKAQARISGTCVRGWLVYKRDQDEITSAKRIGASDALMQRCDIY